MTTPRPDLRTPAGRYDRPKRWGYIEITKDTEDGERVVYMRRWYLWQCKWFSVRVHHIRKPDLDRDPHDHPWRFVSIILWGGYTEFWCPTADYIRELTACGWEGRRKRVRFINLHSETDLHQITEFDRPEGVWSLFITGPVLRKWGFRTPAGWVPWDEYDAQGAMGADPGEC